MSKLHLILPMAGRGSRFFKNGFVCPKPLIEINGKPFFYWAARSVEKFVDCADLTFVVLEEHIRDFAIDEKNQGVLACGPHCGAARGDRGRGRHGAEGLRGPARR